ncbi:MAG: DNA-binding response regulator, partial [Anaerolineae bacterium]|nr:DNA-binding response regulator [Anaerolineae bacterium]
MGDVRILVVASDPLARAGLAALLAGLPECTVVGRAAAGEDVPSAVEAHRPDVVLWDLGLSL